MGWVSSPGWLRVLAVVGMTALIALAVIASISVPVFNEEKPAISSYCV